MLNRVLQKLGAGVVAAALGSSALADDGVGPILRYQRDVSRERGWMLTPEGVVVFDYRTRQTSASIPLPGWIWAGEAYLCAPDLALGPKGEAIISSNVIPTLWRIDPVSLGVTKHELTIDAHVEKDVGFTGLTYSAELGAYFGISPFGALWRIDPLLRRAQEVRLNDSIGRACGLSAIPRSIERRPLRFLRLCVHGPGAQWSIHLAPDQRAGYVRRSCGV